jgi:hypothetical protein
MLQRRMVYPLVIVLASFVAFPSIAQDLGVNDDKYIDFIRAIAKSNALAKTRDPDAVKFISLGASTAGEVVVLRIAVGWDHGSSFEPGAGAIAVAHVHTRRMSTKPESADFEALRLLKVRGFVISADGENIWEITIIAGKEQYRPILPSVVGDWIPLSR